MPAASAPFIEGESSIRLPRQPAVHIHACRFTFERYAPSLYPSQRIELPASVRSASPLRGAEYLAGRLCARAALRALGCPLDLPPTALAHSAPVWPSGWVGSLSHTRRWAVAAAAHRREATHPGRQGAGQGESQAQASCASTGDAAADFGRVSGDPGTVNSGLRHCGIDCEALLSPETAQEIAGQVMRPAELARLVAGLGDLPLAVTLAFSLKESAYKAFHALLRPGIDFQAFSVAAIDLANGSARLCLPPGILPHDVVEGELARLDATTWMTLIAV